MIFAFYAEVVSTAFFYAVIDFQIFGRSDARTHGGFWI